MRISKKKYLGWRIDSISVNHKKFTVNLLRPLLLSSDRIDIAAQPMRAEINFSSVKKVILSKVLGGAEINEIKQNDDNKGYITYILKFSIDSFIEITATTITDLQF